MFGKPCGSLRSDLVVGGIRRVARQVVGRKSESWCTWPKDDFIVDHDVTRSRFGRLPNRERTPKFAANWARMKDPRMLNKSATRQGGITVGCLACKIMTLQVLEGDFTPRGVESRAELG
jgi:hypothetical protein